VRYAVKISKHIAAREWLIFLALFLLGLPACFFLGDYYRYYPYPYSHFWNEAFGLSKAWSLALWLLPYLFVTLWRLTWWSIKAVLPHPSSTRIAFAVIASIALLVLAIGYWRHALEEHTRHERIIIRNY